MEESKKAKTNTANLVKNYIGIDIGGTTIKGAIINHSGDILREARIETSAKGDGEGLRNNVVALVNEMVMGYGGFKSSFGGIGIGCPGLIDSKRGMIVFSGNLGLNYYPLGSVVSDSLGMSVKVTNDANAAALGEAKFGAGKKYKDSILITLGTGVGGGIVVDGKLFEGGSSAGTEIGHTVIVENGEPCTCGRKGCLEAYSSATALIRKTKEIMQENEDSAMWKKYNLKMVSGKTAFDYAETDEAAKVLWIGTLNTLPVALPTLQIYSVRKWLCSAAVWRHKKINSQNPFRSCWTNKFLRGKDTQVLKLLPLRLVIKQAFTERQL